MANPETIQHRADRRISAVGSLKEIIILLAALSITNGLREVAPFLFRDGQMFTNNKAALALILMILNVVRFYHGNIRLLDDTYIYDNELGKRGGIGVYDRRANLEIDFMFSFSLSLLFTVSSFYVIVPSLFVFFFLFILMLDVLWYFIALSPTSAPPSVLKTQRRWTINNSVTIVVSFVALFIIIFLESGRVQALLYDDRIFWGLGTIFLLNTLFDFVISRTFYFPSESL